MSEELTARILFLIDKQADCDRFSDLLKDFEFPVDSSWVKNLKAFQTEHEKKGSDLLLYWHQRNLVDEKQLVKVLDEIENPPVLIFVADQLNPRDFINAMKAHASDVINAGMPAQYAFVIRRELASIWTRRKLEAAIDQFTQDQIIDESKLSTQSDSANMGEMVETIDDALKNEKLELIFQPIIAVSDDNCDNYEVFVRIKTEDGYLKPHEFLPVAEQYGLMPAIDRWVVKNTVKRYKAEEQVKKIRKQDDRKLRFFLNISGHSLVDEVIMPNIVVELVQAKFTPGTFVIEVDKKTVLSRLQKTKSLNQNVKKLQLEFAIDHYEASDNTLNYLKHISLDYIKVNNMVTQGLDKDAEKRQALKDIIEKARENNVKVVASQVEHAEVLPLLYELGIDYIQGFLIAEPSTRLEHPNLDNTIESSSEDITLNG